MISEGLTKPAPKTAWEKEERKDYLQGIAKERKRRGGKKKEI